MDNFYIFANYSNARLFLSNKGNLDKGIVTTNQINKDVKSPRCLYIIILISYRRNVQ